jgi:hypothetical protein
VDSAVSHQQQEQDNLDVDSSGMATKQQKHGEIDVDSDVPPVRDEACEVSTT